MGLHNTDYHNFQGRLGFAYRVAENTSLRGGYSRFYDEWNGVSQFAQNVGGNWPSVGLTQIAAENQNIVTATINDPTSEGTNPIIYPPPTPFGNVTFYFNPDMKTPYTDQWNLGIDQQFSNAATLSVSYAVSHSGRLDLGGIHNTARFPAPGDAATVASRRQYPYIAPTYYDDSTGNSNYHALQTRLTGNDRHGLTYLLAYTWSKSIDLAQSGDFTEGGSLQDPYNPRADRSVSGFDLTNIFSASVVYELPFGKGKPFNPQNHIVSYAAGGWQVNSIVNLTSGPPFEVDLNGDIANTGNTFVHANRTGAQPYHQAGTLKQQWLNPAAFAAPPPDTFGNGGRNSLRADGTRDLDLSIFRTFPIRDSLALNFRAESFNLTNSVNFNVPNSTLNSNNFGLVTSSRNNPRQIQFALKLAF